MLGVVEKIEVNGPPGVVASGPKAGSVVATARDGSQPEFFAVTCDLATLRKRADSLCGNPFVRIPGVHRAKVEPENRDAVEMVYNDWVTINAILGEGVYERFASNAELYALAIARLVYTA